MSGGVPEGKGRACRDAWLARSSQSGARHAPSLAPRPARSFVSPPVPKFPSWWDAAQKLTKGSAPSQARADLARLPKEVAALIKAGGLSSKVAAATPPLRGAAA